MILVESAVVVFFSIFVTCHYRAVLTEMSLTEVPIPAPAAKKKENLQYLPFSRGSLFQFQNEAWLSGHSVDISLQLDSARGIILSIHSRF